MAVAIQWQRRQMKQSGLGGKKKWTGVTGLLGLRARRPDLVRLTTDSAPMLQLPSAYRLTLYAQYRAVLCMKAGFCMETMVVGKSGAAAALRLAYHQLALWLDLWSESKRERPLPLAELRDQYFVNSACPRRLA